MASHDHHHHENGHAGHDHHADGHVEDRWQAPPMPAGAHEHMFLGAQHDRNERRTWMVIGLTTVMMVAEIAAGSIFGSMALLADGFHMSTHAGALLIAALAYLYARRHARDPRFSFGTGKIGDLAAFSSAIILAVVVVAIGYESVVRLYAPVPILFGEAIVVAVIGLAVNLVSAFLLHQGDHGHDHGHGHAHHGGHDHAGHDHSDHAHHGHGHHAHDQNLRAAYLHVLADALTSVLAIVGLLAGWFYGWLWMDAVVGILGAVVIARWSVGLLKDSGSVLLDVVPSLETACSIRRTIEAQGDRVTDLHLWRVGPGHMAAVVSLATAKPAAPEIYKRKLRQIAGLSHVSVEVNAI